MTIMLETGARFELFVFGLESGQQGRPSHFVLALHDPVAIPTDGLELRHDKKF
jgi:hypothetical protein